MKRTLFLGTCIFICSINYAIAHSPTTGSPPLQDISWERIVPPISAIVTDGNGNQREITPSCSGALEITGFNELGQPQFSTANTEYSFFYRKGKADKLLVYFDGGGACWDGETCGSSILPALDPNAAPTFVGKIKPGFDPSSFGGIFDLNNSKNPFQDYSMLFVPYCTGDIHWGSNTAIYKNANFAGIPLGDLVIEHRGFDNFLSIREWIKSKRFTRRGNSEVEALAITGSSAGAYGATLAFPYMKQLFPKAKAQLISDGANGIVVDNFLEDAVRAENAPWNARSNFPNWVPAFEDAAFGSANSFAATIYGGVAMQYPRDTFAQYTTSWDMVQVLFYNIMNVQAAGAGPTYWTALSPERVGDWHFRMKGNVYAAAMAPNYRYYVAPGCIHTTLRYSDQLYAESTTHTPIYKWMLRMINGGQQYWESEDCDEASCPPPSAVEAEQCLAFSFSEVLNP